MKKLLSMALAIGIIASISPNVFASSTEKITIIKNEIEISEILKEKGLYDENEEVLAVIEIDKSTPEVSSTPSPHRGIFTKDIYVEADGTDSGTEYSAWSTSFFPAGSFGLELPLNSEWTLKDNLGLKIELLEAALGHELNASTTDTIIYNYKNDSKDNSDPFTFYPKDDSEDDFEHYSVPFIVKAHVNYDRKYYKVYDEDLIFDDYIGETYIERETGYTIKVVKQ